MQTESLHPNGLWLVFGLLFSFLLSSLLSGLFADNIATLLSCEDMLVGLPTYYDPFKPNLIKSSDAIIG